MNENNFGVETPVENNQPEMTSTPMPQETVAPVAPAEPTPAAVDPYAAQPAAPVEPAPVAPAPVEGKKKGKLPIIIIIVVLLVALGVGGFFVYKSIVSKPKNILDSSIDLLVNKSLLAKNELKDRLKFDYKKETIESSGSISISFEGSTGEFKTLADLGKVGIDYDTVISIPNKQFSASLAYKEGDNKIVSGEAFYKDKKVYYQFPDLIKQAFYEEIPEEIDIDKILDESIKSVSFENYDKIVEKMAIFLKKSIKEEYLVQESGSYKVDGVDVKGLKTSFDLSEVRLIDIENAYLKQMSEDEEFLKLLTEFIPTISKEEYKKEMEETIKSNDEALKNATGDVIATVNIYSTDLGKFLALTAINKEDGKNEEFITSVTVDDVNTTKIHAEVSTNKLASFNLSLSTEDESMITNCIDDPTGLTNNCGGGVTQPSPVAEKKTIEIKTDNKNKVTEIKVDKIVVKFAKVSNGYSFNFDADGLVVNGTLTFDYKDKNEKEDFKLDIKSEGIKVALAANGETKLADGIKTFDVSNAKKMAELTQEEAQTMNTNLGLRLLTSKVYTVIIQELQKQMQQQQTQYYIDDYEDYEGDL